MEKKSVNLEKLLRDTREDIYFEKELSLSKDIIKEVMDSYFKVRRKYLKEGYTIQEPDVGSIKVSFRNLVNHINKNSKTVPYGAAYTVAKISASIEKEFRDELSNKVPKE